MNKTHIKLFYEDAKITLINIKLFQANSTLMKTYTAILILFIAATLPMPYEFYISLRMLICIGLFIFLYTLKKNNAQNTPHYKYILLGLVLLYNPLFVIHLGSKVIWAIVNTGTLYFLFTIRGKLDVGNELSG